jgi:hypothetical protein
MKENKIPPEFYSDSLSTPEAYSVGDLKEILQTLPDNLRINCGFSQGVMVVVYNVNCEGKNPALEFEECDE